MPVAGEGVGAWPNLSSYASSPACPRAKRPRRLTWYDEGIARSSARRSTKPVITQECSGKGRATCHWRNVDRSSLCSTRAGAGHAPTFSAEMVVARSRPRRAGLGDRGRRSPNLSLLTRPEESRPRHPLHPVQANGFPFGGDGDSLSLWDVWLPV